MVTMGASCTTAYDAYGRPRTVVEPGAAILGAAAVGLLAYGLASSDDGHRHRGYRGHGGGHYHGHDHCDY